MKRRTIRFTAKVMIIVMAYQLVLPATRSFALTSGPSQPEVQSFEPVGTTDMVDIFSGDFVYNIPLMDVEGYPINISYHSGANIEQEASWVGLGWNINPGEINRGVRGVPDDFDGDTISKFLNIKPEKDFRLKLGVSIGTEAFGFMNIGFSAGQFISYNNYKGMGIGVDVGAALSTPIASTGIGIGVGSLEGASIDANAGLKFSTSTTESGNSGSISLNGSTGFNTRSGLKDISYGVSIGVSNTQKRSPKDDQSDENDKDRTTGKGGIGFGSSIPIGLQNYVAVVTNASSLSAFSLQVKLGIEAMWMYPHFSTTVSWSQLSYARDGSLPAFGYLNAQNAGDNGIMDFSREKDGVYNSSLPNLPLSSMTYDVYSISGQGTGGMFRPFRSDIGSVFDPLVSSSSASDNFNLELGVGIGPVGGLFEFGTDISVFRSRVESGPWARKSFKKNEVRSLFENAYFKQGGELTYSLQQDAPNLVSASPVYASGDGLLRSGSGASLGQLPSIYSEQENRSARANNLSFVTNADMGANATRPSYPIKKFIGSNAVTDNRPRSGTTVNKAKAKHIAEITQTLPDGRRYVYGLPAMNNLQKEATFSVDNVNKNINNGLVKFNSTGINKQDSSGNRTGRDNYFQAVYTPAYAHSYLLTSVLSTDYADVNGDGPTEDDLGSYTKFNYSLSDSDYRWVAPYQARESVDSAQYNPGFWSDLRDDKGNYVMGSKEMWYMHSVETKNMIAEFYISERQDGRGMTKKLATDYDAGTAIDAYLKNAKTAASVSYKLDSIKLFNKHDRFVNEANAIPIKTVVFDYDYSLCPGIPNRVANTGLGNGKLTLKRIYFRYGKSDKSLLNPYVFNYDTINNKPYSFANKDRWGNYKPTDVFLTNYEYPYVRQDKASADSNSRNWQMTEIKLPSGGKLKINYEADDYSYVQDKRSMEMVRIAGVGASANFEPKDVLYENEDLPYDYVYFYRDPTRELAGKTMRENYLEGTDLLYFSFNLDIAARNRYENIKGYAKVEDVGISSDANYGYIKLRRESAGGNSGSMLNPITLAGLNTGRYYLPHIIYPGYNDGDPNVTEVMKGMLSAVNELLTITQNTNIRFVKNGLAKKFVPLKSWIRLHSPGYTKMGGGSRVKELRLEDSWNNMVGNGTLATYGRSYDYTTLKDNNIRISSGVASYEPMVGADENPLRRPVDYTAQAGKLMPAIECYQEEPFGESFYPSPSVGYSKVTVRSINNTNATAASPKAEDIYEFYTAKDFPIETTFSAKNTPVSIKHKTLTNKQEELQVLQGYVVRLNDMHGKAKSVSNYVIKPDNINRELITSTRYNYQVDAQGKLENTVKAVKRDHLVKPVWSVTNLKLGEEVDLTVDSRKREMESSNMTVAFNLNVVNFLLVTIPIPTVFFPDMNEHSLFQTMVTTKVIQQYGILKSVEVNDHGAKTISENVLYDSETGQVLLSKVSNEFEEPVNNITYPAHWAYDNMGGAYYNVGYEEYFDSAYVDNCERGRLIHGLDPKRFNTGDELSVRYKLVHNGTVGQEQTKMMYVVGTAPLRSSLNCDPNDPSSVLFPCTIIIEPRAKSPGGYVTFPWAFGGDYLKDIYVKVTRSGRRNMLGSSVQQLVVNGDFPVTTFADLFSSTKFGIGGTGQSSLLAANVTTYKETGLNEEFTRSGQGGDFGLSSFLRGETGNWREWATYTWKGPRFYPTPAHARKDGLFESFQPFWKKGTLAADSSSCSILDYTMYANPVTGWQKLKEVTVYNAYGLPVEELDAAGIPSSALYGNNFSLPLAVANNAKNKQVKFLGFEDLMLIQHEDKWKYGIWETLVPSGPPADSVTYYGFQYHKRGATGFVSGATITAGAHTGNYCLTTTGNALIKVANVSDYAGTGYCYASIWVRRTSGVAPSATQVRINAAGKDALGNPISQNFTAFTIKTAPIEGWYKLEGKLDMSLLAPYTDINITLFTGYMIDDFRMIPDGANMKSFAYDVFTNRLMAELDENNFATFYEYDQEGVLVRVKKESDRGILTVNEHRKANEKKNY